MKIKGAFPVRWAAQNGSDGKGVTIVKTEIKYAADTSGTTKPSSGWQATIPSVSDGNYLWTWTHVEYSDGTKTDAYSVSRHGIDGKGIKSSTADYKQMENTNIAPENITGWGSFPTNLTDGWWLYTRQTVTYSDGATAVSYSVVQIGQGAYYAGLSEYYCASNSTNEPPSGYPTKTQNDGSNFLETEYPLLFANGETIQIGNNWKSTRSEVKLNSETPYLWNFEISRDSKGNQYVTFPSLIGNFAKGIVSIAETYAISAQGSAPNGGYPSDIKDKDWTDEHFAAAPTNSKPYQWNKTVTTYNDGTYDIVYHVSSVKGIDGKGAIYIDLDNENDSILYDGQGNRIGESATSNIRLYENGKDITIGKTFAISSKSPAVTAEIEGSVLTVADITSNDGYVTVRCDYNSASYYATFTVKRLVGVDKYEVVCTPSALTFNDDTDTGSQVTVTIQVYKTAQNGSRDLLLSLPAGYSVIRKWTDTQTTGTAMSYSEGKAAFNPYDNMYDRYRIELLDASKNVLDYETIPISHVKNGEKGDSTFVLDADNENVGFIVEDTGIYSTAQTREIGISAYYGANHASEVTYSVSVEGNTDDSGSAYLSVGSVTNGKLTIGLKDAIAWKKDTVVKITVTATHAKYGTRSIVINCVPVFGGAKADYYDLLPSLPSITFTKTSDGKSLTPSSRTLTVQCLHVTSTGQTPVSIPSGYSVRYSYTSHPTTSTSGTEFPIDGLEVKSATTNTIVYLSLFNGTILVDKESVPIIKGGIDGETTLYYVVPSADKITRKHDGTLSPTTINCKAYKKTGTDDPELVTSGAQGSYDYYVGTKKYTVDNYTGIDISPTTWWTKIVFYLKSSDGIVLTQREILVENEDVSPEQNLLNDTNFTNLLLDSSTNKFKSEVFEGEGVDGSNALFCNPDSLEKDIVPYTQMWQQSVSQPNDKRLLPSTWYTLSFWAKSLGYSQIDIKQSSNLYGFARKSVYLVVGTHTLRIRGYASTQALSANRELRVFIYNDDWTWSTNVEIRQSSITEAEVTFNITTEGTYKIASYCYVNGGGNAAEGQTVYVEWYRLKIANRTSKLHSYCYPNVIDTSHVQVHDGNVYDSRPSNGNNLVSLTTSWKRFYMVFKTKSTIPDETNMVLFRIPQDGNSVYLSQMKLERGVFPTAWTGSNRDSKGYSGAKPDFKKYSQLKGTETKVYQGVGDEEWYTIVYDDENNTGWYVPKYTHNMSADELLSDESKWLFSNMQFVATSVFFAQMAYIENLGVRNVLLSKDNKIEGGMCCSDDSLGLGNIRFWLGSSSPSSGKIIGYEDGSFELAGGNARFNKDGNAYINNLTATNGSFEGVVNATSGTFSNGEFTNVKIKGSMRCPFQKPDDDIIYADTHDNVILVSQPGPWLKDYQMPWGTEQSGRRITLVNWEWGDNTSTGTAPIFTGQAKGGFWENGEAKNRIDVGREVVELLGYGTDTEFFGWIVLRRVNL